MQATSATFVTSDGVDIHYKIEGQGPWVTLIHGIGSDHESWNAIARILAPHFTVLRADLRGHGASSRISQCSIDAFTSDVAELLNELNIDKTHLVGFSLGGLIGQKYAIGRPSNLARLVLISSVAERTPEERERVRKRAGQIDREGIASVTGAAEDRWFTPAFKAANPHLVEARLKQLMANDHRSYAAAYRVFGEADEGLQFSRIEVPTLIVTGENDSGSSPRMARLLHDTIQGSELRILPDLRHSVLVEAPETIAALVLDFLQKA
jgi:pimeloyl-ACP methyl ester carboxylesterase